MSKSLLRATNYRKEQVLVNFQHLEQSICFALFINTNQNETSLISIMQAEITGFEHLQDAYPSDTDFGPIWKSCEPSKLTPGYHIYNGFLFKGHMLCPHVHSFHKFLIIELHTGGLAAFTRHDKTLALLEESFYWPHMRCEVSKFIERCIVCQTSKEQHPLLQFWS